MNTWRDHIEAAERLAERAGDRNCSPQAIGALCHLIAKHLDLANFLLDVKDGEQS